MGWFGKKLGKKPVAYFEWYAGAARDGCAKAAEMDGTCWLPERKDVKGPPAQAGCTLAGGCTCRTLEIYLDEAWGPGNADFIRRKGGLVTGAQMKKFISG